MPKLIKMYACEICGEIHSSIAFAEQCEARGNPAEPPAGLVLTTNYGGSLPPSFAALCTGVVQRFNHHEFKVGTHWFRDNGCGDDKGPRYDIAHTDWHEWANTDTTVPVFERAVALARKLSMTPQILRDGKVVPYNEDG